VGNRAVKVPPLFAIFNHRTEAVDPVLKIGDANPIGIKHGRIHAGAFMNFLFELPPPFQRRNIGKLHVITPFALLLEIDFDPQPRAHINCEPISNPRATLELHVNTGIFKNVAPFLPEWNRGSEQLADMCCFK